jgi:transcriptional regulator with XRE-family HTH domain
MLDLPAVQPEKQQPETRHILEVLRAAMRVLDVPVRELEKRMGLSSSYLSRLLSGKLPLRFDQLIRIARALGIEPAHLFHEAFPYRPQPGHRGEAMSTVEGAIRALSPAPPEPEPAPIGPDEIEALMEKTLRRLFERLSRDESE